MATEVAVTMSMEKPKIALVYHDSGDKRRLPFLETLAELISLVEPGVDCEIFSALRLFFEKKVHEAYKVTVFIFSEDTDFPAFPTDMRAFFTLKNEDDLIVVSQRRLTKDPAFKSVFFAKNLLKKANNWCPGFFQKLFPLKSAGSSADKDVVFVCDNSSKSEVSWCKTLVDQLKELGGKAVCPGTAEWASADDIMAAIKPTTLVVLVVKKDGLDLMMKFGPMINAAKERAKVIIAAKNEKKVSSDLKAQAITLYSREHPIDLWIGLLSHLSLVSCTGTDMPDVMPFAKGKVKTNDVEESGDCKWTTVLIVILLILFIPIAFVLLVVAMFFELQRQFGIDLAKSESKQIHAV